jgi:hypothetical protein
MQLYRDCVQAQPQALWLTLQTSPFSIALHCALCYITLHQITHCIALH